MAHAKLIENVTGTVKTATLIPQPIETDKTLFVINLGMPNTFDLLHVKLINKLHTMSISTT